MTTIYVLDASVLLSDHLAPLRFAEHDVVIPLVAISNLTKKLDDPELGGLAARALRFLEEMRVEHGGLVAPIETDEGGTVRVEINHQDRSGLPEVLRSDTTEHRVLAVAKSLQDENPGARIVVVSKDLPLRLKAAVVSIESEEYRNEQAATAWSGMLRVKTDAATVNALYEHGMVEMGEVRDEPVNSGVIASHGSQSAIGRIRADKKVHLIRRTPELFGLTARSAEQQVAMDMLADDTVGIVSLGGRAGTGKSIMAIAAGLDAVVERRVMERVVVFRPMYAVGGQDYGHLPGDHNDKMAPWAAAVFDSLAGIAGKNVVDEVIARDQLEVLPLTHIRGRTLSNAFVVIDEAQNLERAVLLTALSRLGENSRVVLTHDTAQRDNIRVGRFDGIAAVVDRLKGEPLFGHVTLSKSERSPIAELVTRLLD